MSDDLDPLDPEDLDPEDFLRFARSLRGEIFEVANLEWLSTADVSNAEIYRFAEHLLKWPQGIAAAILAIAVERLDAGDVGTGVLFLRIFYAMVALDETEPEPGAALH